MIEKKPCSVDSTDAKKSVIRLTVDLRTIMCHSVEDIFIFSKKSQKSCRSPCQKLG